MDCTACNVIHYAYGRPSTSHSTSHMHAILPQPDLQMLMIAVHACGRHDWNCDWTLRPMTVLVGQTTPLIELDQIECFILSRTHLDPLKYYYHGIVYSHVTE